MERIYRIGLFSDIQGFAASVVSVDAGNLFTIHQVETGSLSQDSLQRTIQKMWNENKQPIIYLNHFAPTEESLNRKYSFEVAKFDPTQDIGMLVYQVNNGNVKVEAENKNLIFESLATCSDQSSVNPVVSSLAIALKDLQYVDSSFVRVGRPRVFGDGDPWDPWGQKSNRTAGDFLREYQAPKSRWDW